MLIDGRKSLGTFYLLNEAAIDKKQFKVGSLDQLMELVDTFGKYDNQLDSSCKRNEQVYFQTA